MVTRRAVLSWLGGSSLFPSAALAREVTDLSWQDLLPEGEFSVPQALQSLIDHDGPDMSRAQPASSGVRADWNGQVVRMRGFIVPLEFSGSGVTAFILAPFVGACIHVPPPPANQLVFVTSKEPFENKGLSTPVHVTGRLSVSTISTHLAQVGYAMVAERIVPYS